MSCLSAAFEEGYKNEEMAAFLRVSRVVAAVLSMAAVAEKMEMDSSQMESDAAPRKHHHQHKENPTEMDVAALRESSRFASIQQGLIEAWKERTHLEQLQHTIASQKTLLDQQKKLMQQGSDAVSDAEKGQLQTVRHLVKDSQSMMSKVRMSAIKKVKDAMSEVMNIDEEAGKDMERNRKLMEEAKATIARAAAANVRDEKIRARSQKVLAAAVQEGKYFKNFAIAKNKDKEASETENSLVETAQKEDASEKKADEASEEKAHKMEHKKGNAPSIIFNHVGTEKGVTADAQDDWGKLDEEIAQKKELSQENLQKEDEAAPKDDEEGVSKQSPKVQKDESPKTDEDLNPKEKALVNEYLQVMSDDS